MTKGLENDNDQEIFFGGRGQIIANSLFRKIMYHKKYFECKVVSKWVQNCLNFIGETVWKE